MKYETLINILDSIRMDAPKEYVSYHPAFEDIEGTNQARSKAFIHLFLKVKFGLLNFEQRHEYITDGPNDGGLDAYYIDYENKNIYLLQSKFRTTQSNFEEKEITIEELVKMETKRIIEGELLDSNSNEFNSKINLFQGKLKKISDIARYKYIIIILGNLKKYNDEQIHRVIGDFPFEVFDYEKTYLNLVFPMCKCTFYDPNMIQWIINLEEKNISKLEEDINTSIGTCTVDIVFIPLVEISNFIEKYQNSVLLYNPRNYLDLKNNPVNKNIQNSILSNANNDFSILNNGITIVCSKFEHSTRTGDRNRSQIIANDPQIINGAQTACTISKISDKKLLQDKKVMVKFISMYLNDENEGEDRIRFIEKISNATNFQTKVSDSDRKSNEYVQRELQKSLFKKYGYLYEIKKGEFSEALSQKIISKAQIIDRAKLIRSYYAFKGDAGAARRKSENELFGDQFSDIFNDYKDTAHILFSYLTYDYLDGINANRKNSFLYTKYGNALRYGKFAIVHAVSKLLSKTDNDLLNLKIIVETVKSLCELVLLQWLSFEEYVSKLDKNKSYFSNSKDFDNYYKNFSTDQDIIIYPWKMK